MYYEFEKFLVYKTKYLLLLKTEQNLSVCVSRACILLLKIQKSFLIVYIIYIMNLFDGFLINH